MKASDAATKAGQSLDEAKVKTQYDKEGAAVLQQIGDAYLRLATLLADHPEVQI